MNFKHNIWLDCDPGYDDMLALIMATMNESIRLIGLSTSAGNSTIQNTTKNALNILAQVKKTEIEVIQGSDSPLIRELILSSQFHGQSGLQEIQLAQSTKKAIKKAPIYQIYKRISAEAQPIRFVATGALTNVALLLKIFPQIKQKIKDITIMGGAVGKGNQSPAAQFNIFGDPQAASIVFNSSILINVVPLQVTETVLIDQSVFDRLQKMQTNFPKKLIPLCRYVQKNYKEWEDFDYPVAHDPCTIFFILHPEFFQGRKAYVEVQLEGKSRGRTNCKFLHIKQHNSFICEKIAVSQFWDQMLKCIQKID